MSKPPHGGERYSPSAHGDPLDRCGFVYPHGFVCGKVERSHILAPDVFGHPFVASATTSAASTPASEARAACNCQGAPTESGHHVQCASRTPPPPEKCPTCGDVAKPGGACHNFTNAAPPTSGKERLRDAQGKLRSLAAGEWTTYEVLRAFVYEVFKAPPEQADERRITPELMDRLKNAERIERECAEAVFDKQALDKILKDTNEKADERGEEYANTCAKCPETAEHPTHDGQSRFWRHNFIQYRPTPPAEAPRGVRVHPFLCFNHRCDDPACTKEHSVLMPPQAEAPGGVVLLHMERDGSLSIHTKTYNHACRDVPLIPYVPARLLDESRCNALEVQCEQDREIARLKRLLDEARKAIERVREATDEAANPNNVGTDQSKLSFLIRDICAALPVKR